MKKSKMIVMLISMLIATLLCGCSINFNKEEETTETESSEEEVVYIPTLEEILGYSGEDLMTSESQYNYQRVMVYTDIEMTGEYRGRTTPVKYASSYTDISDAYYKNSIFTESIIIDNNEDISVTMRYADIHDQSEYTNRNYTGWIEKPVKLIDTRSHILDDWFTIDDFREEGNYVIVEGTISPNGKATVTNLLYYFIMEYGGRSDALNYISYFAKFDKSNQQLVNLEYTAELEEVLAYGDYQLMVDSIKCTYIIVEENNDKILTIPEYVRSSAQTESTEEVQEEYVTIIESLFGIEPSTMGDTSFDTLGIVYDTEYESIDYAMVEDIMRTILTTLSVEDFIESYPDDYQSDEEVLAAATIMSIIPNEESAEESTEEITEDVVE